MARVLSILFIGDVVGEPGMDALRNYLPPKIVEVGADLVIVNGENVTNGKGLTEEEATEIFQLGAHVITTGNHIWENWKSRPLLASNPKVLRPHNYPVGNPGKGYISFTMPNGRNVGIMQLQGRTYMQAIDCPFKAADAVLPKLQAHSNVIIVDFHADASAEKVAMGWYLDGKVTAVLGTHTHIQTNDAKILPQGTAHISDVGMTGPYDSVIGLKTEIALKRITLQTAHKYELATDNIKMCGCHVIADEDSGKALSIEPFTIPQHVRNVASM